MSFLIAYVTFPDEETAETITRQLVGEKLIACGNSFPISSSYWWKGNIQLEDEYVSILKTTSLKWEMMSKRVEELHPYEIPCIMKFEVEANEAYERWIEESIS